MKKIIILMILSFLLVSCWLNDDVNVNNNSTSTIKKENWPNVVWILKSWDISKCDELKDPEKIQNCVDNINYDNARKNLDLEFCNKITNEKLLKSCNQEIIFSKANITKDINICDDLIDETSIAWCKNNITMNLVYEKEDIGLCEDYIWDKNICRDNYNLSLFNQTKEKEYCEKIIDENIKQTCLSQILDQTNDVSVCEAIEDEKDKKDCIDSFSEHGLNIENNLDL